MTPRLEIIGDARLHLGDCREVELLPADCVATDPPYRLTSGGKNDSGFMQTGWLADYDNKGAPVTCDIEWPEVLALVARLLADPADAYVFCNDKNIREALNAAHDAGLRFHNMLVWDKVAAIPNRWYMKNCEFVAYLYKGKARTILDPSCKQLMRVAQVDESAHPTEKPVGLMRTYIENSTAPGERVLDPFMGTGTTGVAALRSGRRFEGVEVEPRWFDVACRRIEAATRQGELFGAAAE